MSLDAIDFALAGGATLVAGAVNALAGGGTLVSFPTLVAIGVPALSANVTNTVALCPGYLSGTVAQREDLQGQRRRVRALGVAAAIGGLTGSVLLEITPESAFRSVVPWLLVLSCVLLAGQDRTRAWVKARSATGDTTGAPRGATTVDGWATPARREPAGAAGAPGDRAAVVDVGRPSWILLGTIFLGAVYGGFFGAGLGIMMLALLGLFLDDSLIRINAVKQALQLIINVVAAAFFAISGHVRWELVPVMAVAALVGGTVGGRLSRVVNPTWLRRAVVVFGLAVAVDFWVTQ